MKAFSFVHAADLHLDAPFRGLSRELALDPESGGPLPALLRDAGFTALKRLTDMCIDSGADCLLLAGDIYNSAESSLRARLALREAFLRLETEGIAVFVAHGNHDPLQDDGGAAFWPDSVTVFGAEVGEAPLMRRSDGAAVGRVYGVSHRTEREGRNLAALFKEKGAAARDGLFRIGLLHCALAGFSGSHELYAPCSAADLLAADMDYWALGHVHGPRFIDRRGGDMASPEALNPLAAYAGSLQGLHVNESGPHGCLFGRVEADGTCLVRAVPLAPLRWEALTIEPGPETESVPALERLILEKLEALAGEVWPGENGDGPLPDDGGQGRFPDDGGQGRLAQALIVRLTLSGRSPLNRTLRAPDAAGDLRAHLNAELSGSGVFVRELRIRLRPVPDMDALRERPDLAGEVLREAARLSASPEALAGAAAEALAPFFSRPRLAKLTRSPEGGELTELLDEAALLCLDLLGADGGDDNESGIGADTGGSAGDGTDAAASARAGGG